MVQLSGQPGTASAQSSVYTLLNSAIGAGVLSLPYAFRAAGWAAGIIATFAVAGIEGLTMYWLARYAEFTQSRTYSELARKMLGRKAALAMSVMLILYSFGSGTAYLIILGDCYQPMVAAALGQRWWTSRRVVIPLLGSATMLPLSFPQSLAAISGFSALTPVALACVSCAIAWRAWGFVAAPGYDWSLVHPWERPLSFIDALPILAFGFHCHPVISGVFYELSDEPGSLLGSAADLAGLATGGGGGNGGNGSGSPAPDGAAQQQGQQAQQGQQGQQGPGLQRVVRLFNPPRRFVRPAGRTPKLLGMVQVLVVALGLTAAFYLAVGLCGYLSFPASAKSNILLNYAEGDPLMQVARALVGLIQIFHYPVNHSPARAAARDLLAQLTGRPFTGRTFNACEVLAYFGATLTTALLVTDLGQVFKLIGGLCGAFFIFLMPGLLVLQYSYSKHLHVREGGEPLLLPAAAAEAGDIGGGGGAAELAAQQAQQAERHAELDRYHFLTSRLFWSGVALQVMGAGLISLTVYSLLAPPV